MKAWRFTDPDRPIELIEVPDPHPAPGEVVIDVRAAGLCHSDVDILEGGALLGRLTQRPIVLGHEVSGVIRQIGEGVSRFSPGDRVAVYGQGYRLTPEGHQHEARRDSIGLGRDGGFAEQTTAWEYELTKLPDGVPFDQGASATDAGMTAYHAVQVGEVSEGQRVGIVGLGGLGFTGARIAKIIGAQVIAAETNQSIHAAALEAGLDDVVTSAEELIGHNLDAVIDYAGFGTTTAAAIEAVRPGGRVVQVGLGVPTATLSTYSVVMKQLSVIGSLGGTVEDLADVIDLLDSGRLRLATEVIEFADIAEQLARLARGDLLGTRLVAVSEARQ